jgi:hypothetical protein
MLLLDSTRLEDILITPFRMFISSSFFFSKKEKVFYSMDEPWKYYGQGRKLDTKGQTLYDSTYMKYLE